MMCPHQTDLCCDRQQLDAGECMIPDVGHHVAFRVVYYAGCGPDSSVPHCFEERQAVPIIITSRASGPSRDVHCRARYLQLSGIGVTGRCLVPDIVQWAPQGTRCWWRRAKCSRKTAETLPTDRAAIEAGDDYIPLLMGTACDRLMASHCQTWVRHPQHLSCLPTNNSHYRRIV